MRRETGEKFIMKYSEYMELECRKIHHHNARSKITALHRLHLTIRVNVIGRE